MVYDGFVPCERLWDMFRQNGYIWIPRTERMGKSHREWVEMAHLSLWTFSCFHRLCFPVYRKGSILLNIMNFANVTKHLSHSDRHFSRKNATWMPHNRLPEKTVERRSGLGRCPPETNSSSLPMLQYVAMIYSRNQSSWFELRCFSQEIQHDRVDRIIEIIWYTTCVHAGRCRMVHRAPLENMTYQKVWFLRHLCSLSPVHPSSHLFTCTGAANECQWPLRMSTEHGARPSMIRSLRAHWKCLSTAQPTSPKSKRPFHRNTR